MHEEIKLGAATRDRWLDNYCENICVVGSAGISVVYYNFMPVFDWIRTDLAQQQPDESTALAYSHSNMQAMDMSIGTGQLPGWGAVYDVPELNRLLNAWRVVNAERLWEHLAFFLERLVPVAEENGDRMAMHPDDSPWPVLSLPRIITNVDSLCRLLHLVDRPAN